MPALGKGMKPVVMPSYPHMLSQDVEIWSKYLKSPIVPIKEVWYDIHVGAREKTAGGPGTIEARIAAGISRKRIDAVCRVGGGFWVVEIKPFGSMLALGQVVTYTRLFIQEFRPPGEVWPVIVCEKMDDDLADEFDEAGVAVIET